MGKNYIKRGAKKVILYYISIIWMFASFIGVMNGIYTASVVDVAGGLGYALGAGVVGFIGYYVYKEAKR